MSYKKDWQHFEENFLGRDFVVSDIHGHFMMLYDLLTRVKFNPKVDRLFSGGDNIDRGPESHMVLKFLDRPSVFSLLGNHEQMAIDNHKFNDWQQYGVHGGQWFLDLPREKQAEYVRRFERLPLVFEVDVPYGRVGIVHAECPPNDWLKFKYDFDHYRHDAIWGFNRFNSAQNDKHHEIENINFVINGHCQVYEVSKSANTIYIDTGKYAKKLSLLEINHPEGFKIHQ